MIIETRIGLLAVASSLALSPSTATAAASPFVGQWQLNRAQSQLPPNEPAAESVAVNIARVDALHVKWTTLTSSGPGQPATESFDIPANGEFYPISPDTTAALNLAGPALQATFKGSSGDIDTLTCTVSPDQRRMTCKGSVGQENGTMVPYVDVFDRK